MLNRGFQIIPCTVSIRNSAEWTTQYWQKTAPTGCDLNGSETLTNLFASNITGWTDSAVQAVTIAWQNNAGRIHVTNGNLAAKNSTTLGGATATVVFFPKVSPYKYITWTPTGSPSKWTNQCWVYMPTADSTKQVAPVLYNTTKGTPLVTGGTVTVTANTWTLIVLNAAYSGTTTGVGWGLLWITPGQSDSFTSPSPL